MSQFPMSTFVSDILERYKDKLETEQMEALHCRASTGNGRQLLGIRKRK